ncbi:MAG: histidine phosphatase family protein [Cyanobacteria bacterium J06627_28]
MQTETTAELSTASDQIANASAPSSATEEALWTQLMEADEETYVVLLRHAIAPGTGDPANFQLNDCSTQRNLSEAGRQQAMEIGEVFRDRNIPVTKVLSSQWCRCLETAELMDIAPVEPFSPLNSFFRDRSTAESQTAQVKDYVAETEAASGVIVMVTHQVNITALSDIVPQSGSAVVMQLNDGRLEVLGQLLEDDS